jgi:Leucine-rich repeat (LRR) protein
LFDRAIQDARGVYPLISSAGNAGRSAVLNFSDFGLTSIPVELFKQVGLRSLNLRNNRIGQIPDDISMLRELREFDASGNRLTLLPEGLGQTTNIERLVMQGNSLIQLPMSFGQLIHLLELDLSQNQLTALPESLGQLIRLQSLKLSGNKLTVLPEWLGRLTQLQELNLSDNRLTALPDWLGQLAQLRTLNISGNRVKALPEWLGRLTQLQTLGLASNQLTALPEWLGQLTQLQSLDLSYNQPTALPESLCQLTQLQTLNLSHNQLTALPESLGRLKQLQELRLSGNQLTALPESLDQLSHLQTLDLSFNQLMALPESLAAMQGLQQLNLDANPLNPELAAAYEQGLETVKRYLRAKAQAQVVLNEAKLILVGEGEVGKSCLLDALRGDPWEEGRPTTHGIKIKPVTVTDPATGAEITLNGWDFGGQRVYRPTHQLFFSAPAVYLVVWKPREGPQQGFVKEWIRLVKHREPDAKILVVATHGGPKERQPDIDRQEIWDLFGKETVIDFHLVESKPDEKSGERRGIAELKQAIARVAASLPEVGRSVPKRWQETRRALNESGAAYLSVKIVLELCTAYGMDEEEARDFIRVAHRLGHLIYYEHDPALQDIVVLKPDWLATAMSYVLDDKQTREAHGLVEFARLSELWNDPARPAESRYDARLHPLFLRLMERFDLSYKVAVPAEPENALGFWQRIGSFVRTMKKPLAELHYTSLIAQLVPDLRPMEQELAIVWPAHLPAGDGQQVQICRIVETKNGQSANAEGLFFQLIVRLHKYSLGRVNYRESVHWQRGLVLDDDYNGRALLEHIGNDVRITVRAPYPQAFLAVLTHEVKWLVENFWAGLRCDVMVPCIEPCGMKAPGTGLYEVQRLIESKRRGRLEYPCPVCQEWQNIDCLLRNATAARSAPLEELLADFAAVKAQLVRARKQLIEQRGEGLWRFARLDMNTQRVLSKVDDAFTALIRGMADEAKEGPRLFSFEPVNHSAFNPKGWMKQKFRLTLWCEHSRLPLPVLNKREPERGVYEFEVTREWFVQAAPFLKVLTGTLSLVLPIASSATKIVLEDAAYKAIEDTLDFGKECADAVLKGSEKVIEWADERDKPKLEPALASDRPVRADGAVLRHLQVWLKEKDPGFGGLVRVQNKRQEFLWVHPQFEKEY